MPILRPFSKASRGFTSKCKRKVPAKNQCQFSGHSARRQEALRANGKKSPRKKPMPTLRPFSKASRGVTSKCKREVPARNQRASRGFTSKCKRKVPARKQCQLSGHSGRRQEALRANVNEKSPQETKGRQEALRANAKEKSPQETNANSPAIQEGVKRLYEQMFIKKTNTKQKRVPARKPEPDFLDVFSSASPGRLPRRDLRARDRNPKPGSRPVGIGKAAFVNSLPCTGCLERW